MFSHIMLGANDIEASKEFYDAVFNVLGYQPGVFDEKGRCFYWTDTGVFALSIPIDGEPATKGNGSTIGFLAKSERHVDDWHAVGLEKGGSLCEEPPGIREGSGMNLYIAYLLDPAGNKVCAVYRAV